MSPRTHTFGKMQAQGCAAEMREREEGEARESARTKEPSYTYLRETVGRRAARRESESMSN